MIFFFKMFGRKIALCKCVFWLNFFHRWDMWPMGLLFFLLQKTTCKCQSNCVPVKHPRKDLPILPGFLERPHTSMQWASYQSHLTVPIKWRHDTHLCVRLVTIIWYHLHIEFYKLKITHIHISNEYWFPKNLFWKKNLRKRMYWQLEADQGVCF